MSLKGTKTEENLKAAFAGESQANRRYLYFAQKADIEGYNDVATVFRSTAEGETGHAHGHLDLLLFLQLVFLLLDHQLVLSTQDVHEHDQFHLQQLI